MRLLQKCGVPIPKPRSTPAAGASTASQGGASPKPNESPALSQSSSRLGGTSVNTANVVGYGSESPDNQVGRQLTLEDADIIITINALFSGWKPAGVVHLLGLSSERLQLEEAGRRNLTVHRYAYCEQTVRRGELTSSDLRSRVSGQV